MRQSLPSVSGNPCRVAAAERRRSCGAATQLPCFQWNSWVFEYSGQAQIWRDACKTIGVRIAGAKSMNPSPTESWLTNASSGPSSFLEILASASAMPQSSSYGIPVAVPGVSSQGDSDSGEANSQAHPSANAGTDGLANEKTGSIIPVITARSAAALGTELAQEQASTTRSAASHTPVRESKTQSASAAITSPSIPVSTVGQQTTSTSFMISAPAAPAAVEPAAPLTAGSISESLAGTGNTAIEKTRTQVDAPSLAAADIEDNSQGTVESASAQAAGAASIQARNSDKSQASANATTGATSPAKDASTDEPASTSISSQQGAPGFAPDQLGIASASTESMLSLAAGSLPEMCDAFQLPGGLSKNDAAQSNGSQNSKSGNALLSQGSNGTITAGTGKSKDSDAATGALGTSTHSVVSDAQSAQRPDANASQPAPDAARSASPVSLQIQQGSTSPVPHSASTPPAHSESAPPSPARTGEAQGSSATPDSAPTSVVNTANVLQKMGQSEMNVAVHSTEFGAISIRTSVTEQQMLAQISVDHTDLGKVLSAHIPAMEAKLGGELGVRTVVAVNQAGMSFSGQGGQSSQGQQRSFAGASAPIAGVPASTEIDDSGFYAATSRGSDARLDVRA